MFKINDISRKFNIKGNLVSYYQITDGHINITYKVTFNNNGLSTSYILQRMNKYVFKNPPKLMDNIFSCTEYIKEKLEKDNINPNRLVLNFLKTFDDKKYYLDEEGEYWRCYYYVSDSVTYNNISSLSILEEGGKAFGNFLNNLSEFDASSLYEIIPNFHNTIDRYNKLKESIRLDKYKRATEVKDLIDEFLKFEPLAIEMTLMLNNNELPLRVTHNDTKCNNVLFDIKTGKSLAVIDLDTIMPGLSGFDFGDAIRTGAANAKEDESGLSLIYCDIEKFKAFAKGYLKEVKSSLTKNEIDTLPLGAFTMATECGVRFLTDYLDGDIYFHVKYEKQNLIRARNQLYLAKDIYSKLDLLSDIIKNI